MSQRTNAQFLFLSLCHFILFKHVQSFSFKTLPAPTTGRSTTYKPRVTYKTCLLKPDRGPCRGNIDMYYFRPSTMNCTTFKWGGCQGNGNRFDTMDQCNRTCLSDASRRDGRPVWCNLRYDYGYCFGAVTRYFYDSIWKTCKEAIYSGCGGNKNNFYSKEQCDRVCRFGKRAYTYATKGTDKLKKVLIINPSNVTRSVNATKKKKTATKTTSKSKSKGTGRHKYYFSNDTYSTSWTE